jgi:purine-nucleoside phosphorylase
MKRYRRLVTETADFLRNRLKSLPEVGILTGTGLADSVRSIPVLDVFLYTDLPHFPVSTVPGHPGKLVFGSIADRPVMIMQGRVHLYEGYSPQEVTFSIRVMQQLGVSHLIVTNAAGGLNSQFHPGDIMCIRDHVNLSGANPLIGPNADDWGVRFPDMTTAYDPLLRQWAAAGAQAAQIRLQSGIYAGLHGPSLETPAEIRFLKTIGCDAVGFSTVQEVICAVHAGMKVLGLSTITNINDPDNPVPATVEGIIAVAKSSAPAVDALVRYVVENIDAPEID